MKRTVVRENTIYCGAGHPDHDTLAGFRRRFQDEPAGMSVLGFRSFLLREPRQITGERRLVCLARNSKRMTAWRPQQDRSIACRRQINPVSPQNAYTRPKS
jgi:hypothetical protein